MNRTSINTMTLSRYLFALGLLAALSIATYLLLQENIYPSRSVLLWSM